MATNQEVIIAALQSSLGAGFEGHTYEGLWHAFWDDQSVASGNFDERMLTWINSRLGESFESLPRAMQAFAENAGYYNWLSMTSINLVSGVTGSGGPGSPIGLLLALTKANP